MLALLIYILHYLNPPVVIVHCETTFDGAARVAQEITILSQSKQVYLLTDSENWRETTEIPEVKATEVIFAPSGSNQLRLSKVIVTGGYFRACFAIAVKDLHDNGATELQIPTKAVYFGKKRTLYEYLRFNLATDNERIGYLREVARNEFGISNAVITLSENLETIVIQCQ